MDAKLTLKLDRFVIDEAKKYASSHQRSLSRLIESYLRSLIDTESQDSGLEITPFVQSMKSGVELPIDLDAKKEYGSYLSEKH